MARVLRAFRDRETWRRYAKGDEYEGPREAELAAGGYVEAPKATRAAKARARG